MAQQTALALINGQISEIPSGDTVRGASGSTTIQELYSVPVTPVAGSMWVQANAVLTAGSPMGLLLSLTNSNSTYTYSLKYRTNEGTTIGTPLT